MQIDNRRLGRAVRSFARRTRRLSSPPRINPQQDRTLADTVARTAPPVDVQALREREFPHVGRAPYLNAASMGPLPERARHAVEAYNLRRSRIHELRGDD